MNDIRADIASLIQKTAVLTRAVESGGTVDLGGLDGRIHDICEAVLARPEAEARALREDVETLLGAIDVLRLALIESAAGIVATETDAPPGP
jgi:hypothetical protein